MSVKPIVQVESSQHFNPQIGLRAQANPVESFDSELRTVADDLLDTLMAHKIAVGLAAPQIGVPLQIAAIGLERSRELAFFVCNPRIVSATGKKKTGNESCMSVPGFGGPVERRDKVRFEYQDLTGAPLVMEATGFLARVLQHEIDHLAGMLYLDRLTERAALRPVDIFERD